MVRTRSGFGCLCLAIAALGCGGSPPDPIAPASRPGAGSITAVAQGAVGPARSLAVDYAAAGISGADPARQLVIVGVFRDGRVDDTLDLETLSISVPISELGSATNGVVDLMVDGSQLNVLLEGTSGSETLVLSPEEVRGTLHLRFDAPPRAGIVLRGDFSLEVASARLKLEGELEVPVLGG